MSDGQRSFDPPTFIERLFNRGVGSLVRLGLGGGHMYLLEVRGRKSGRVYTTPVDLLTEAERRFLVAPRGKTQWVRNAQAAAEVTLRRGRHAESFRLRVLSDTEKPPILKAYLERFRGEVQRFFPVPAGSPLEAFTPLAPRYPVFELLAPQPGQPAK
jgi:deazaflavin-dependent oxidoreductase (nitroreductase family)